MLNQVSRNTQQQHLNVSLEVESFQKYCVCSHEDSLGIYQLRNEEHIFHIIHVINLHFRTLNFIVKTLLKCCLQITIFNP